jgi:hypothetical protein
MGEKQPLEDERLSHTMCDACLAHFSRQWGGLKLGEYLDDFEVPVIVLDENRRVQAANQLMADRLGKSQREMYGLLGGEAMECAYARLPEGCGETVHCKTCAVRLSVEATLETGEPQARVPATLDQDDICIQFIISTTIMNGMVGVMIEEIDPEQIDQ